MLNSDIFVLLELRLDGMDGKWIRILIRIQNLYRKNQGQFKVWTLDFVYFVLKISPLHCEKCLLPACLTGVGARLKLIR